MVMVPICTKTTEPIESKFGTESYVKYISSISLDRDFDTGLC